MHPALESWNRYAATYRRAINRPATTYATLGGVRIALPDSTRRDLFCDADAHLAAFAFAAGLGICYNPQDAR